MSNRQDICDTCGYRRWEHSVKGDDHEFRDQVGGVQISIMAGTQCSGCGGDLYQTVSGKFTCVTGNCGRNLHESIKGAPVPSSRRTGMTLFASLYGSEDEEVKEFNTSPPEPEPEKPTLTRKENPEAAGLRSLIGRLQKGLVEKFRSDSSKEDVTHPLAKANVKDANVVTSRHTASAPVRHALLLDIDHPAWLVKSSTPGHYHLYVDVPDGIPHNKYMRLLGVLADCGVIEDGYAKTSQKRGYTTLRLPWIKKTDAEKRAEKTTRPKPVTAVDPAGSVTGRLNVQGPPLQIPRGGIQFNQSSPDSTKTTWTNYLQQMLVEEAHTARDEQLRSNTQKGMRGRG